MKLEIIIILILTVVAFVLFGVLGLILYFILKFLRKKFRIGYIFLQNRNLKIGIISLVALMSIYEAYTAVYPNESFYVSESEYVTLENLPRSAIIKEKSSSYPDLHGDYFSKSKIELSKKDFQNL